MRLLRLFALLIVLVGVAVGCGGGDDGPPRHPVYGTVTFDGQPVPEGEIIFLPADGQGAPDAGKIENGTFNFQAAAGQKKVEITAHRDVPGKTETGAMGEEIPVREQYVPARYNAESELTAEVKPDGENKFEFPLTGQ